MLDIIISTVSYSAAFLLRFEGRIPAEQLTIVFTMTPFIVAVRSPIHVYFGLYQTLWQYLGIPELLSIIKAVTIGTLLLPLVPFLFQFDFQPRSTLIID